MAASSGITEGEHLRAGESTALNRPLAELLTEAYASVTPDTPSITTLLGRLKDLSGRLSEERFQLAVLGQFKRGKSTLINALLGAPIMPMAVTPLTAIPTFIESGNSFHLRSVLLSGSTQDIPAINLQSLNALLAARVTEESNPDNRLGLASVHITLPASLIRPGTILIDTPGVGSTYKHNTETAHAILQECDAALFVVSPDPPITETELDYLALINKFVPHLILVLNKIDLVAGADRDAAVNFLRKVAANVPGLSHAPMFCISARQALKAKADRETVALKESGLDDLEAHLGGFITNDKTTALDHAIAFKARALIADLKFNLDSRLATLKMPVEELGARLREFETAAIKFERERQRNHDLIAGDRKRLLTELDTTSEDLLSRTTMTLKTEIIAETERSVPPTDISNRIAEQIPRIFETEFQTFDGMVRQRFSSAMGIHEEKAADLVDRVRRLAADILSIPYTPLAPADAFQLKTLPYWVTDPRNTLSVVPSDAFDIFLPQRTRKRRKSRQLIQDMEEVVMRNVENLRWSLHRNLDDGFRLFEARLDDQLRYALDATREALRRGIERHAAATSQADPKIDATRAAADRLDQIGRALDALLSN